MKKFIVFLVSVALIAAFGALVHYGLRHARGVPTVPEKIERAGLVVPFLDKQIDLTQGLDEDVWQAVSGTNIKLVYQVMVLPWPKSVVPSVEVKAFHNKKDIYFHLSWKDDGEDRVHEVNKFSDACALMLPLGENIHEPTLMMGFMGKSNLWHWKASSDREFWYKEPPKSEAYSDRHYPFEEEELFPVSKPPMASAVGDLISMRVATVTIKETQSVEGRGVYKDGSWSVVMRRSLAAADPELDAVFLLGKKRLCAFAVWNGSKLDRGGRKSISDWVELVLQ